MCECSQNATKASTLCAVQSISAPFSQQIIFCPHIMKWSAAKWTVEYRFFKRPLIKNKGGGGQEGNFQDWRKSGQMSTQWASEKMRDTNRTERNNRIIGALLLSLWGISIHLSRAPDSTSKRLHSSDPLPAHTGASPGSESSINAWISRLLNSSFPAVITLLNSWI